VEHLHHETELAVLGHDALSNGERSVTRAEATALISSGYYRESMGAPVGAIHYRRSLDDGSCLHLVIEGNDRRLHHDSFDPHAGLFSLTMHAAQEAKVEAVSLVALAWNMVRLLAR
jgi:hypothetical protein